MSKNMKGILTVLAITALGLAVWYITHQNTKAYARQIVKLGGATGYATLLTFDEAYLKAWAKALMAGSKNFSYKNEAYNTAGGKKIVIG